METPTPAVVRTVSKHANEPQLSALVRHQPEDVTFLIVDDDTVMTMALKREFDRLDLKNPVRVARNGIEALDILRGSMGEAKLMPPFVLTLDINMPVMNGLEFLEAVRADPALCQIVVFVLTTSDTPADVARAYRSNVAGYIVKDDLRASLRKALEFLNCYSQVVELPN